MNEFPYNITQEEFEKYEFVAENARMFRAKSAVILFSKAVDQRTGDWSFDGTKDKIILNYKQTRSPYELKDYIRFTHPSIKLKDLKEEDFVRKDIVLKKGAERSQFFISLLKEKRRLEEQTDDEIAWIFDDQSNL